MSDLDLIDTHCHLDRFLEKGQWPAVRERALQAGVQQLIAVGTDPSDWPIYQRLALEHPGQVFHSVGLHPCHVADDWEQTIGQLAAFWREGPRPVALGEIGLDAFHLPKDPAERAVCLQRQYAAFRAQLALAKELDTPIIVHSRNAAAECVAEIDAASFDWSKVVFHCWSDGPEGLTPLLNRGARASFTGILTFKSAQEVREAALHQGTDRLMVETDAPYLAPEPHRGQTCEPAYVRHTAARAAELFGLELEALARKTSTNAREFFSLPRPNGGG